MLLLGGIQGGLSFPPGSGCGIVPRFFASSSREAGLLVNNKRNRQYLPAPIRRCRRAVRTCATTSKASLPASDHTGIAFQNDAEHSLTVITLEGRRDAGVIMQVTTMLLQNDILVTSASINSELDDGRTGSVFQVTDASGMLLAEDRWDGLREKLAKIINAGSQRSTKPAIHGVTDSTEAKPAPTWASESAANALELAAKEVSEAAKIVVSLDRELVNLTSSESDASLLDIKQDERAEASSLLERKMAALEAVLASRRFHVIRETLETKELTPSIPSIMAPPPTITTGPAAGSGYEIILQGFNWESCKDDWYRKLVPMIADFSDAGFSAIWLPPPTDSVSPEGYLPRDLYDLNSKYGTEAELRGLIATLHEHGLKAIADIVINHRCAHYQDGDGKWNKFGGRLAWDRSVICANNPIFNGGGSWKKEEDYSAAPNIDHSQEHVRTDITEWMRWLRTSIGFDGWRFDFVKGYSGKYNAEYVNATVPEMAFGEYWDTCSYSDGVLAYNQDAHRQRTIDWCDATGGTCAAFDFTLKGIMQEAVSRQEYWRLSDSQGRPPGVIGMWPSRAITFLENHDTGSTLQHWPYPWGNVPEGYAYLMTHPGTPCVFFDHYMDSGHRFHIDKLIEIRLKFRINSRSEVAIKRAENDLYSAIIDKKIAVKLGPGDWAPQYEQGDFGNRKWDLLHSGPNFAVWEGK